MTKYFINGFAERRGYFLSVGSFTEEEKERLEKGEVVEKNGNSFWIEKGE